MSTLAQADLLHPLTSLEWPHPWPKDIPIAVRDGQAVWLNEKLYIGGGLTGSSVTDAIILCSDGDLKSWTSIKSPTYWSALTTYRGKLVLAGGVEVATECTTNKLWSLQEDGTWAEELPPMPTQRSRPTALSTGQHLLVAGGVGVGGAEGAVEVFDGEKWSRSESLPKGGPNMKSALFKGEWYLMGGPMQGRSVFSASVDALLATAGTGERTHTVWRTLPEAPLERSSTAVFGSHLLAIGGKNEYGDINDIYAFIPSAQSWLQVEKLPMWLLYLTCPFVLPSGELVVIGGKHLLKASLRVDSFPDGKLSVKALERLLHATKVPLFQSIGTEWQHFAQVLDITVGPITHRNLQVNNPEERGRHVIKEWLERSHYCCEPRTWRSLVVALASLKSTEPLATAISHYFGAPSIPSDTKSTRKEQHEQALDEELWEYQHFHEMAEEPMFYSHGPFRLPSLAHDRSQSVSPSTPTSLLEKKTKESSQSLERMTKERGTVVSERDTVVAERDTAVAERDIAVAERDTAVAERDTAVAERDTAVAERNKAVAERNALKAIMAMGRDIAVAERDAAVEERDTVVAKMDALKEQLAKIKEIEASTMAMGYLRGVDVIARTSFEVTSQALTYEWRDYGVKLHVQQDSLPADCQQCRVEMRASLSGQYALSADCDLVSGVYWVHCPVKLSKRATLEVQHCSSQKEGLSFVRAECTQEQLPYVFRRQEGGVFSEHSSHGSIELSRFSGWGIGRFFTSRHPDSQQYSGQVYYASDAPNKWQVLFAITRNLDLDAVAFRRKLEEIMMQKISKVGGPPFSVEFTADSIELEVPVPPDGWRLSCPTHPAILRKYVDRYKAKRNYRLPCCQLDASLHAGAQVETMLEEKINLKGAKEPYNFFRIECDPTTTGPARLTQPATPGPAGRPQDGELSVRSVTGALREFSDWEALGVRLGVGMAKTREIGRSRNYRDPHLCLADLVAHWLGSDMEASWERVASALEEMDWQMEARDIRTAHAPQGVHH